MNSTDNKTSQPDNLDPKNDELVSDGFSYEGFSSEDCALGSWWNRSYTFKVKFPANDYAEFSTYFQQMSDLMAEWHKQHGRKARVLEVSVLAHPWILKRVLQQFNTSFGTGHPYGDFCKQGTVKLHLHDAFDADGTHYLLYQAGKKPTNNNK